MTSLPRGALDNSPMAAKRSVVMTMDGAGGVSEDTGDLELTIRNLNELDKAKPLIQKSFEEN